MLKVHGCYEVFAVVAWACYRWQQHVCLVVLWLWVRILLHLDRCVHSYKWLASLVGVSESLWLTELWSHYCAANRFNVNCVVNEIWWPHGGDYQDHSLPRLMLWNIAGKYWHFSVTCHLHLLARRVCWMRDNGTWCNEERTGTGAVSKQWPNEFSQLHDLTC